LGNPAHHLATGDDGVLHFRKQGQYLAPSLAHYLALITLDDEGGALQRPFNLIPDFPMAGFTMGLAFQAYGGVENTGERGNVAILSHILVDALADALGERHAIGGIGASQIGNMPCQSRKTILPKSYNISSSRVVCKFTPTHTLPWGLVPYPYNKNI
jgi:hypothetical protein